MSLKHNMILPFSLTRQLSKQAHKGCDGQVSTTFWLYSIILIIGKGHTTLVLQVEALHPPCCSKGELLLVYLLTLLRL